VRGKIVSKILLLSVIASLFAALATPAFAVTVDVSTPEIQDLTMVPGTTDVAVPVTVADVSDLWGFQFILSYDPTVMMATSYVVATIFSEPAPSEIGADYASIAASMPFGELSGFSGSMVVATVYFTIMGTGGCVLDLHDSLLVTPMAQPIAHTVTDGTFANVVPDVSLELRRAIPDHVQWFESKSFTNTLHAKVKNKGNVATLVYVTFTIADESGLFQTTVATDPVNIGPNQFKDFTLSIDRFWLIAHGASVPGYGWYFFTARVWFYIGENVYTDGRLVQKQHFELQP